ncbi:MAG: hypothetical protein P1P80_01720 [ANME-2 cluster archaeon]|nr:hypothetical protein [ANME-2 cluster archaeon]
MAENNESKMICQKWNKPVAEATCNICKNQCDLSIANPDNFIAKKLIVDMEKVKVNRLRLQLYNKSNIESTRLAPEPEPKPGPDIGPEQETDDEDFDLEFNNIDFIKEEIEDTFKERADSIIDSLGLAHMKNNKKEKEET